MSIGQYFLMIMERIFWLIGLLSQFEGFLFGVLDFVRLFSESVDGRREGGPWDAEEDVHPPGLPLNGRAVDAEGGFLPQTQTDEQH